MQDNQDIIEEQVAEEQSLSIRRRGIYILPNLFTTGSLFSGFYAIVAGMNHLFSAAAIAILVALVLDGLDGRVARLINAQSAFGGEYDSLSDLVSFGVAPALVAYNWALIKLYPLGFGKAGWLCAFTFVACVALRLARFNTREDDSVSKRYFFGLPCPAAAALIATTIWVGDIYSVNGKWVAFTMAFVLVFVALLMVSNIRFRSFKDIDLKSTVRFTVIVGFVLTLVLIALHPIEIIFLLFVIYVLSGPVFGLINLWRKRKEVVG